MRRVICVQYARFICFFSYIWMSGASSFEILPEYSDLPSMHLLSPLQGSYNGEDVEISWRCEKVSMNGIGAEAIIFVNGLKAHSSLELQGTLMLQKLPQGTYRVDAMLAAYDEIDGLTNVTSTHVVEFHVGSPIQDPVDPNNQGTR